MHIQAHKTKVVGREKENIMRQGIGSRPYRRNGPAHNATHPAIVSSVFALYEGRIGGELRQPNIFGAVGPKIVGALQNTVGETKGLSTSAPEFTQIHQANAALVGE